MWVSQGATTVTLTSFRGLSAADVAAYLKSNGLTGVENKGRSSDVAVGQVYKQQPPAGTTVKRGSTVTYWVSSGQPQATVPDVTGMTVSQAQTALQAKGLTLGTPTQQTSTSVSAGLIISQDPAADAKVATGTAVNVVVSSGTPTPTATPTPTTSASSALITVPDVYTMDASTATDQLQAKGFVVVVKEHTSTSGTPGTVIKMNPDAGTTVPARLDDRAHHRQVTGGEGGAGPRSGPAPALT